MFLKRYQLNGEIMELTLFGGTFVTKRMLVFSFMVYGSERNVNMSDRKNSKHLR